MKNIILLIALILYGFSSHAQSTRDSCASGDCKNGQGTRYSIGAESVFQIYIGSFKNGVFEGQGMLISEKDTVTGTFHKGEVTGIYVRKLVKESMGRLGYIYDLSDKGNYDVMTVYDDGQLELKCFRNDKFNSELTKKATNKALNQAADVFLAAYKGKLRPRSEGWK
ncbi:MAG: hypothetical protein ABI378_03865 [Chitinophagaceae bacterium]